MSEHHTEAAPCTDPEAWRTFLRAHALVSRRIEADLLAGHRLPLASYEVLVHLADAPDGRLRMAELADLLVVSRSGVTRAVDRLARQGLVRRQACDSDLRGTFAVITEAGRARLEQAAETHRAGVRFYWLDPLGPEHAEALGRMLDPVIVRLEQA